MFCLVLISFLNVSVFLCLSKQIFQRDKIKTNIIWGKFKIKMYSFSLSIFIFAYSCWCAIFGLIFSEFLKVFYQHSSLFFLFLSHKIDRCSHQVIYSAYPFSLNLLFSFVSCSIFVYFILFFSMIDTWYSLESLYLLSRLLGLFRFHIFSFPFCPVFLFYNPRVDILEANHVMMLLLSEADGVAFERRKSISHLFEDFSRRRRAAGNEMRSGINTQVLR